MDTMNILMNTKGGVYDRAFWNSMRAKKSDEDAMKNARVPGAGTYFLPMEGNKVFVNERSEFATIRSLATELKHYQGGADIISASCDDYASFISEGDKIPGMDVMNDFAKMRIQFCKSVVFVKAPMEFIYDASFDFEKYLIKRMAGAFARAEDKVFINGTGINEPTGLLHDTDGAETTATVDTLTYDNVIELFFSVKPEYRKKVVWLMNDSTALALRKLKDADGNYLWN